ncbi:carbohydrate-binding protein, partial [Chromobacterium piscinae]|uniref:carbohydrate-binding protein n=1 Tax=Chromobacterium piscinae TaxID=686831 RepID=UPI00325FF2E9
MSKTLMLVKSGLAAGAIGGVALVAGTAPSGAPFPAAHSSYLLKTADSSCADPAWNATAVYTGGQRVSYQNQTWQAKWWTQGNTPSAGDASPWQLIGQCGGGCRWPAVPRRRIIGYFTSWRTGKDG